MLVERKLLSQKKLDEALRMHAESTMRFGEFLTTMGSISEEDVASCLAEQYGFELANPETLNPSEEALALVDWNFASAYTLLPIDVGPHEAVCIVADPMEVFATDVFEQRANRRLKILVAPRTRLQRAIAHAYRQPFDEKPPLLVVPGTKKKRAPKVDPQVDRIALLDALRTRGLAR